MHSETASPRTAHWRQFVHSAAAAAAADCSRQRTTTIVHSLKHSATATYEYCWLPRAGDRAQGCRGNGHRIGRRRRRGYPCRRAPQARNDTVRSSTNKPQLCMNRWVCVLHSKRCVCPWFPYIQQRCTLVIVVFGGEPVSTTEIRLLYLNSKGRYGREAGAMLQVTSEDRNSSADCANCCAHSCLIHYDVVMFFLQSPLCCSFVPVHQ